MDECVSAWLHVVGQTSSEDAKAIFEALEDAGIRTHPLATEAPNDPGILVFDAIGPQLCDYVRKLSGCGASRVLAVASPQAAVNPADLWTLLQAGASDAFLWQRLPNPAWQVARRLERWQAVDTLVDSPLIQKHLVGNSPVWRLVMRQIVEAARFTDASLLILGESGTGKELVARLIHTLDMRQDKGDLIILDCSTVIPELSGSEFFGHEPGAYTGAVRPRDGAFGLAHNGTLFLDEVGELPPVLQAQLLRVVQERTFKPIGSNKWYDTAFRLVCATNRELEKDIARGTFRSDLYYRIATWVCHLPPLRERLEDILPLTQHFLQAMRPGQAVLDLDEPVRAFLLKRPYPGNVRELKQLVTRMYHRHAGDGPLTLGDLPEDERTHHASWIEDWRDVQFDQMVQRALALGAGLKEISQYTADTAVRLAVGQANGNLQRAAVMLGVTNRALQLRRTNQRC